eukprot:scaffold20106_cov111-Isochrysis_galbana.AAC.10
MERCSGHGSHVTGGRRAGRRHACRAHRPSARVMCVLNNRRALCIVRARVARPVSVRLRFDDDTLHYGSMLYVST